MKGDFNSILFSTKEHIIKYKYDYIILIIIGAIIAYFVQVVIFDYKHEDPHWPITRKVHSFIQDCTYKSDNKYLQAISEFTKGKNYIMQFDDETNKIYRKECIVTNWNSFHFLSHFILVLIFPHCYLAIFLASFLYEIYEYVAYDCHDIADVFYNIFGIILALTIRYFTG